MAALTRLKTAVTALKQGAITFLEKPFDLAELCQAIRDAIELDELRRQRFDEREAAEAKIAPLTKKEKEVFTLVAEGITNAGIAAKLGISVRAVEDRRSRMMKKLGTENLEEILELHRAASDSPRSLEHG